MQLSAFHWLKPPAKLANSPYGAPEVVEHMADIFDKTTKLRFRNAGDPQYIKFGTIRDKDPEHDIRAGQLKIPGWVFKYLPFQLNSILNST